MSVITQCLNSCEFHFDTDKNLIRTLTNVRLVLMVCQSSGDWLGDVLLSKVFIRHYGYSIFGINIGSFYNTFPQVCLYRLTKMADFLKLGPRFYVLKFLFTTEPWMITQPVRRHCYSISKGHKQKNSNRSNWSEIRTNNLCISTADCYPIVF